MVVFYGVCFTLMVYKSIILAMQVTWQDFCYFLCGLESGLKFKLLYKSVLILKIGYKNLSFILYNICRIMSQFAGNEVWLWPVGV